MAQSTTTAVLDPAAREVATLTANPPFLFQLGPDRGRAKLDELQAGGIPRPDAEIEDVVVPGGPSGQIPVRIVRPPPQQNGDRRDQNAGREDPFGRLSARVRQATENMLGNNGATGTTLPAILFIHGAGWVFGDAATHDRLIRELAAQSGAAVVFPEYSRSPEARFPIALEESYAVARWVAEHGAAYGLDGSRMAIAGDSVGGNMATVLAMMSKERNGPRFRAQVLLYPVTDADFDTDSYREFAEGYYLGREGMIWFWDQYLPDSGRRSDPMASPLRASTEQLEGLPPALITTNEADVLRDEGEAYASRLREAGVPVTQVRFQGIIHDMAMLDALADTSAARSATSLAALTLRDALHGS
jgi:acetyl esterase